MSLISSLKKAIHPRHPLRLAWHKAKAFAAAARYGFPALQLKIIGVTGTDGKTTTTSMIAHLLHAAGKKVGSLTTAAFFINGTVEGNPTQKTSPSPFMIQKFLRRLVREGCEFAVLEYSSHGLDQARLNFTWPRIAAITNLTPEHLDYHGTMEEYQCAKGRLFHMRGFFMTKVLNLQDRTFADFITVKTQTTYVYSSKAFTDDELKEYFHVYRNTALVYPTNLQLSAEGARWTVNVAEYMPERMTHYVASLDGALGVPGAHNVENALCALACASAVGIPVDEAVDSLTSFHGVPGRMERIDAGQPFSVFVDFTVTPASYTKTLSTLRTLLQPGQRLLVLMGSCGDRMKEKRPIVGKICSELADLVVVTNEDPYTEDPEKIIDEVWAGVDQSKTEAYRISERKDAITFIIQQAKPGDIVILCGKGSDTTMWVKTGQIPWNERELVREILKLKTHT